MDTIDYSFAAIVQNDIKPTAYIYDVKEGETGNCYGDIRYGCLNVYNGGSVTGSYVCSSANFGGDPASGTVK